MLRHTLFLLPLLLFVALPAAAQTETTQLSEMTVELWPDYDRPAMLVLLTGTLPETAALPATVTIPLPENAEVFAIARFNEMNALISDVESSAADGQLTLTTPGRIFRVEYYAPYTVDGDQYSYRFEWISDLTIDSMGAVVQQPIAATDITIVPEPESSAADRGDGLNYFRIAPRPVGAGEPFTVDVTYTVEAPVLSAPAAPAPAATTAATPAGSDGILGDLSPWWLLAIPAVLGLVFGAWYLGRRQGGGSGRPRKPATTRPPSTPAKGSGGARFCHNCGRAAQPGDTFCRNCGTQLK